MGPHHEKKIKRLIYPTLTFSALTTRLYGPSHSCLRISIQEWGHLWLGYTLPKFLRYNKASLGDLGALEILCECHTVLYTQVNRRVEVTSEVDIQAPPGGGAFFKFVHVGESCAEVGLTRVITTLLLLCVQRTTSISAGEDKNAQFVHISFGMKRFCEIHPREIHQCRQTIS